MAAAATITGLLPGSQSIGFAAPLLRVLMRLLPGFSTGGESAVPLRISANGRRRSAARCIYRSFRPSSTLGRGWRPASPPSHDALEGEHHGMGLAHPVPASGSSCRPDNLAAAQDRG